MTDPHEPLRELTLQAAKDTMLSSNPNDTLQHPSFQQLVSIGRGAATDSLIAFLQEDRHEYGWVPLLALFKLWGEEGPAIPDEDAGRYDRLREHWLNWSLARTSP